MVFKKGNVPWNKGTKGIVKANFGSSKKGHTPWNKGKKGLQKSPLKGKEYEEYFGVNRAKEIKRKNSESKKGKHFSPATEFKKGIIPWNKGKCIQLNTGRTHFKKGHKNYWLGKHHSEATKRKLTEIAKEYWAIPANRERLSEIKRKHPTRYWLGKHRPAYSRGGNKGNFRHQKLVKQIAEWLDNRENKVEIEKTVPIGQSWRVLDVLVNDRFCFEIGHCKKDKIRKLTSNGFTVVHMPYSVFEGVI